MNKLWIWSFGGGTKYANKYVLIITNKGDGREFMFETFGQENCCMSYPYEQGIKYVDKYGWERIGVCIEDNLI